MAAKAFDPYPFFIKLSFIMFGSDSSANNYDELKSVGRKRSQALQIEILKKLEQKI